MKTKIISAEFNSENRFVIINEETGEILDDAQGYGYKTEQSAHKASWFRYGGGETKINTEKSETKQFFKNNPEIKNFIINLYDNNFKEICAGLNATEEILKSIKQEFNVELPKFYIKYF